MSYSLATYSPGSFSGSSLLDQWARRAVETALKNSERQAQPAPQQVHEIIDVEAELVTETRAVALPPSEIIARNAAVAPITYAPSTRGIALQRPTLAKGQLLSVSA